MSDIGFCLFSGASIDFEEKLYHLEDDVCNVHMCVSVLQPQQDLSHLPSDHYIVELSKCISNSV